MDRELIDEKLIVFLLSQMCNCTESKSSFPSAPFFPGEEGGVRSWRYSLVLCNDKVHLQTTWRTALRAHP